MRGNGQIAHGVRVLPYAYETNRRRQPDDHSDVVGGPSRLRGFVAGLAGEGYNSQVNALSPNANRNDPFKVDQGQLTFDNEGLENPGGRFHSRILHCPGSWSGVTIGRGYDMKLRSQREVRRDLVNAGVDAATATAMSKGAGLKGNRAKRFCRANRSLSITAEQQKNLHDVVYGEKRAYAADRIKKWTGTDLDAATQTVQDILVDLFFRGDMTRRKWKANNFKRIVSGNDTAALLRLLRNRSLWGNVDTSRYEARIAYLQ